MVQDLTNRKENLTCVYGSFFFSFFSSPALFENPRGDRNYCLCTVRSRKGMPQAVNSIRVRNRDCGLFMQKGNHIEVDWKDWTISTNFFA